MNICKVHYKNCLCEVFCRLIKRCAVVYVQFVCVSVCLSVLLQGHAVHNSYVEPGTLVEASHLPVYSVAEPHQLDTTSARCVARTTVSLLAGPRHRSTDRASHHSAGPRHRSTDRASHHSAGPRHRSTDRASHHSGVDSVAVVVCSASLAGGWDDDDDVTDHVELSSEADVDKFVVDRLLATAQTVVDCGASVLACQKVNSIFFVNNSL